MTRRAGRERLEPWPSFFLVAVVLTAVSLAAVLMLDFLNARKGEPAFIFAQRPGGEPAPRGGETLAGILTASLAEAGVAEESVLLTKDPKGKLVVEVEMPAQAFASVEAALERLLATGPVSVLDRTRTAGTERTEVLWSVRGPGGEEGALSFIIPGEVAGRPLAKAKKAPAGQVALIVDDMGNSMEALDVLIGLGQPVNISVLPYSAQAERTARIAHENGLEVLLHIPLESVNNHEIMEDGDGTILSAMTDEEIRRSFEDGLSRVPHARGVNNHTGSRFTAETGPMRALLAPIGERGLFFVDSRTSADTVAYAEARRMGVPAAERDVFLDADEDRGRIRSRLLELFQKAKKNGRAVGICHPFPETIEVLKTDFGLFRSYGLEVVPVSRLVR